MDDRAAVGSRPGYWFPLVLLGFGLLGLLGWDSVTVTRWFAYTPDPFDHGFVSPAPLVAEGLSTSTTIAGRFETAWYPMRDWPWAALVIATLVATVIWYGRRAGRPVRTRVALALGCGVGASTCYVAAGIADAVPDPAGLLTSVGLPLFGLGALAGVWAYLERGPWRRKATVISAACLAVGVGAVLGAWSPGLLEPVLIVGGLLVLARLEHSRLLVVVAAAVLVAMLVFRFGTLSTLVPAVIVLAAAIVALTRHDRPPEAAAP